MNLFEHTIGLPTESTLAQLLPFGCVHQDDVGHHAELWAEFVETVQKSPPWARAIGLGDYFTFARTHLRTHIRSYKEDEDALMDLDSMCKEKAREFYKKSLAPMKGKLLGLAEGNHHWTFQNGTTDTQYLCELAGVPYFGAGSGHNLRYRVSGHGANVIQALVHHGDWSSGGSTIGGDLNVVERKSAGWDADVYIYAHTHRKIGWKEPICGWPKRRIKEDLKVVERPRVYIRAGCFVRGYVPGCVTYAERKLLKPADLGWVTLTTKFRRVSDGPRSHEFKVEY